MLSHNHRFRQTESNSGKFLSNVVMRCMKFFLKETCIQGPARKKLPLLTSTVDPGYNQRQGNDSGVSYNRTFLYPGFKRNEIASRGQDTH